MMYIILYKCAMNYYVFMCYRPMVVSVLSYEDWLNLTYIKGNLTPQIPKVALSLSMGTPELHICPLLEVTGCLYSRRLYYCTDTSILKDTSTGIMPHTSNRKMYRYVSYR